jgi:hypothetical protein
MYVHVKSSTAALRVVGNRTSVRVLSERMPLAGAMEAAGIEPALRAIPIPCVCGGFGEGLDDVPLADNSHAAVRRDGRQEWNEHTGDGASRT